MAGLLISIATFVSPTKQITPTPPQKISITITPKTTLSATPIPTVVASAKTTTLSLSQRALKVAKFIYGVTTDVEKEELRNKHGVNKSTYEQEIVDHASWYEKNSDVLLMNENRMNAMINGGTSGGGSGTVSQQVGHLENKIQDMESCKQQMDQYATCVKQENEDLDKYNDCVNYNLKNLQDYENCLSSYFNKYCSKSYERYCSKPLTGFCFKPICSY